MKKWLCIISVVLLLAVVAVMLPADRINKALAAEESDATGTFAVLDPLEYLREQGIMEGYEDGEMKPDNKLTRAEFAAILNRAYPDATESEEVHRFRDLSEEHWAFEDVCKATGAGWIQGFEDGSFRPEENITYEQALTIVCRVLGIYAVEDEYPISYISEAMDNSISDGVDALIGETISRLQAGRIIVNAMNYATRQIDGGWNISGLKSGGGGGGSGYSHGSAFYEALYTPPIMFESSSASRVEEVMADGMLVDEPHIFGDPVDSDVFNTEEYTANDENVFKNVATSPLSTFSIDTDTASYSNMRRFILSGQKIQNGSIRTEELINYFDYTPAEIQADKPFGVRYTLAECPWNPENELAMITVSGEEMTKLMPSNIVLLIDVSGSMYSYNKLPLVKESLGLLLNKLDEKDMVSIVTYASGTGVALEPTPASEKKTIMEAIDKLEAGGSTDGAGGIQLAYDLAEKTKCDGNNRVILCTDGDFNVGISSTGELEKLISQKRESGIFLSVLGFGMGNYKDNKMETLADKGNGNYAYIDNLREAKKVLIDDMSKTIYTIAKDVKIQVEFNPEKVSQYRLVGYENRVMNNEDFDDDKKDAGELGAGATVTVFYEIVPGDGTQNRQLKYLTATSNGSDELMTVKIRYKNPDDDESILAEYPVMHQITETPDKDFMFAVAVAELGMILNDSEYKGNSTLDTVIRMAKDAIGDDPYGIRCEFVQLVDLLRYTRNK